MEDYTVKNNDTIFSIASAFGIPAIEIIRANNLKEPYNIKTGQVLSIPVGTYNIYDYYVVKSGDTLYSIARKYNTTVTDIVKLNDLSTNNLTIGQKLLIP